MENNTESLSPRNDQHRNTRRFFRLLLVLLLLLTTVSVVYAGGNSITTPDSDGLTGFYTDLVLDSSGNPVISYHRFDTEELKLMHCNDPNCAGGDETVNIVDTPNTAWMSFVLDSSGYPVIVYRLNPGGLRVMHCNDANCAGGDESITTPDANIFTGFFNALTLDSSGNPVVVYAEFLAGELKVLHCNDPNCAGGDDSITVPDTLTTFSRFEDISLMLDSSGNPVVSYYDPVNGDLKLMHCNDQNCAGGDESITTPDTTDDVGAYTSLRLDGSGNPVVSYYDKSNGDLKILHCNDPDCTGGDESITTPDTEQLSGLYSSLMLDSSGFPVVSYHMGDITQANEGLKVMRCNDPDCAGDDESIATLDPGPDSGGYTSLALDSNSYPVVSYQDGFNDDLKLLHCGSVDCLETTSVSLFQFGSAAPAQPTPWVILLLLLVSGGALLLMRRKRVG